MLILSRKVGETLKIGDDVDITVLGAKGNQIRLGIEAPKVVVVHRKEVFDRIHSESALPVLRTASEEHVASPGPLP